MHGDSEYTKLVMQVQFAVFFLFFFFFILGEGEQIGLYSLKQWVTIHLFVLRILITVWILFLIHFNVSAGLSRQTYYSSLKIYMQVTNEQ